MALVPLAEKGNYFHIYDFKVKPGRGNEFVGAQAGLGYLITTLNFNLDVPGVFAVLILLSLLGIVLHDIVRRIGRRLIFWIRTEPVNLPSA